MPRALTRRAIFLGAALAAMLASPLVIAAAEAKPAEYKPEDIEFFEKHIRPLLVQKCYGCHSEESGAREGGLWLDRRSAVRQGGDSGPAVVPGDVDGSLLIKAVRYRDNNLLMPPDGKLDAQSIRLLEEWVRRGAPDPRDGETAARETRIDLNKAREHWAFKPLARQPLPAMEDGVAGRIDPFIRAKLRERGLTPSPEADRRTLIRRLTFDLTGLPPTPEDVEEFVNDPSDDAYERLVDRLLHSPHYGERWGRMWLDLARYTDAVPSWLNSTAHAHLYRDWVVKALNDDMPYDEFVRRQLATDLMEHTGLEDLPALGFLGLSPTYWKELLLPPDIIKVIVADEWEEHVDALTRTFLGLTVACARCHDHKFEPITVEDYYALAGVFASVKMEDRPMIPEEQYEPVRKAKEQIAKLEKDIATLRKQKPVPTDKIKEIEAEIARIKETTPHFNTPLANVVTENSLYVVQAGDTPQAGTRLEYRPGPQNLHIHIRGNPNNLGPEVPRRFLTVLSQGEPQPFVNGSGRLELANAIFSETAAPLAARVIVNRVWLGHFGHGLVDTPSNFGFSGSRPSHPELLEDLTARFVENGWSLKWLHREIVLSATYRQSSAHHDENHRIDPDNRLLWRMNRRRLEVEAWRDAMLAATGRLDSTIGGPATPLDNVDHRRRTLYGLINRRELTQMLQMHDFPDANQHSEQRIGTTTPLQGLFVLNSPQITTLAEALAQRVQQEFPGNLEQQVTRAYQLLFSRTPDELERSLARSFLNGNPAAWPQYAQVLLGCNEFIYID